MRDSGLPGIGAIRASLSPLKNIPRPSSQISCLKVREIRLLAFIAEWGLELHSWNVSLSSRPVGCAKDGDQQRRPSMGRWSKRSRLGRRSSSKA